MEALLTALLLTTPVASDHAFKALDDRFLLSFRKRAEVATSAPLLWVAEYRVAPGLEWFPHLDDKPVPTLRDFPKELVEALNSSNSINRAAAEKYLAYHAMITRRTAWECERAEGDDVFRIALGKYADPIWAGLNANLRKRDGDRFFAANGFASITQLDMNSTAYAAQEKLTGRRCSSTLQPSRIHRPWPRTAAVHLPHHGAGPRRLFSKGRLSTTSRRIR